ncbi:MAG: hypothetical protein UW46_C0005G0022 [Candidatus Yanofskybacteria bacterium GW2011_GWF1_44_227]|uniref:Uncharacterized protein n=1 Tax=Candidatus Yanofskybacteria bacterium GW2011_GWE2_40_11 TaxID=1619033 RepID=A0A0G0T1K7_9BACT|nr:MAG: hypothetical protein UT69_C0010G0021 [Candidatus Yanofskybacteria bacterium GW2011_GWE1_40_10]KKR40985.1 MAG: hypothetical protein UT75_C0002G0022 [Candidatus Yanofskybacteria bacterium GW2011_GWE2_40_11]KKT15534.1 MAG: hypothetical protein UV97_C0005G0027 [Candidatus Yanofskybacteria bacterium GW2011_GWF2_43_596]KKT53216.1 MAG: hypothetical protein UW46_C0005G0022 [Candidatus Yanofskybacteria bacterium GW2011_GWF1_44_227]OGN35574.1 MAG: hypothetical protein A2207_02435 [Candidatus Yano
MTQVLGKTPAGKLKVLVDGRECEGCPGSLIATHEPGIFTREGEFIALPVVSDVETHQLAVPTVDGQFLFL